MRFAMFIAVWTGLEPATPCVTGRYSNQLNYQTVCFVADNLTKRHIALLNYQTVCVLKLQKIFLCLFNVVQRYNYYICVSSLKQK